MNRVLCCDWLPERARWRFLACSRLLASSNKKIVLFIHKINSLLTKFVRLRWLDIDLVLFLFFCAFMDLDSLSVHAHAKKNLANIQPS